MTYRFDPDTHYWPSDSQIQYEVDQAESGSSTMQHREQAWQAARRNGEDRGTYTVVPERWSWDKGYDAALALAAQLAAALDGLIGAIETDNRIIMRDLKPSREALATYRAALQPQEATR